MTERFGLSPITKLVFNQRKEEVDSMTRLLDNERERLLASYKEYVDDLTERTLITNEPRTQELLHQEINLGIVNEDNWKTWASMDEDEVVRLIRWNYKLMQDARHISGEGFDAVESYLATLIHGVELLEGKDCGDNFGAGFADEVLGD